MKVYVVTCTSWDWTNVDTSVAGVFLNRESAEEFIATQPTDGEDPNYGHQIIEFEARG